MKDRIARRPFLGAAMLMFLGLNFLLLGSCTKGGEAMTVSAGKEVSVEYTLKLEGDQVVDSNVGNDPLKYTHGTHQLIPGFERGLEGMGVGQSRQFKVDAEEGYGPVDENAFKEVEKKQVPEEAHKVGAQLQAQDPGGRTVVIRVSEVKQDSVVLDFNHPLAGKDLYFDVKVLDIQEAGPEEAK